jgi:hypothetical protein
MRAVTGRGWTTAMVQDRTAVISSRPPGEFTGGRGDDALAARCSPSGHETGMRTAVLLAGRVTQAAPST